MATVDKNFRVKNGLVVEGTTATVNGEDILTTASTTTDLTEGTNLYFTDQRAVDAVTDEIDTAVSTAINALDTDDIEEGATNQYFTSQRALDATSSAYDATGTAQGLVDGLDTDDIEEGATNLYYTETRAKDDAAELLTGATLTNITITGTGAGLTITAENGGIQDLTGFDTDDLSEGTTNQYFTSQRALDATASAYDATGTAQGIVDGLDTDDIEEGATNQYFTSQRALDATASAYDPSGAAASAQSAAESYADGLAVNYDPAGSAASAQSAAESYADGLASNYDSAGSAAAAQSAAESYADALVQGLDVKESVVTASTANVDIAINNSGGIGGSALANGDRILLKNQTNIAQNGIYIYSSASQTINASTDPADLEIGKGSYVLVTGGTNAATGWVVTSTAGGGDTWTQFSAANEYTASTGITINGNAISVTADTYDAFGAAAQALSDAEDYADGLATNYESAGSITTAIDALDTDDIEEGATNQYFTSQRALDATASAYDATGTAQGIVDGLDTDDIEEGTTNLYFTDTRAVDALEAVVPNFDAVEVNSLAKQVAATSSPLASVETTAYSFLKADYRTAKFIVKIDNGTENEVTEVLLTLDSSDNIAITEYAIVGTNGNRGSITADISGTSVRLRVTPVDNSTVNVVGTLLA